MLKIISLQFLKTYLLGNYFFLTMNILKLLLATFFVLQVGLLKAQDELYYKENIIFYNELNSPMYNRIIDFDGDGDQDIVMIANGDVVWHENDGTGENYSLHTIYKGLHTGFGIISIEVVDVNKDGKLDIVTAIFLGEMIWLENNSKDQFDKHVIASSSSKVGEFMTGDFDGDGVVDIVAGGPSSDKVYLYENSGDGSSFSKKSLISNVNRLGTLRATDMDKDNDLDIVLEFTDRRGGSYKLIYLINDGRGNFEYYVNLASDIRGVSNLVAEDLDNDNDIDVIVETLWEETTLRWLENKGNDGYVVHNISDVFSSGVKSLRVADLDKDGDFDLVGVVGDQLEWAENNGKVAFTNNVINTSASIRFIEVGDLNNDQTLDLHAVSTSLNKVEWYKNNGSASFTASTVVKSLFVDLTKTVVGDLNGDGHIDILAVFNIDGKMVMYTNNGSGVFTINVLPFNADVVYTPQDLDGDNDLDILYATYTYPSNSTTSTSLAWLENNGSGTFTSHSVTNQDNLMDNVATGDIDKDGDLDLLVVWGNFSKAKVEWYENDGEANFTAHIVQDDFSDDINLLDGVLADMNGDNYMDFVVVGKGLGVVCYMNDGNENFTRLDNQYTNHDYSMYMATADVDGDNDVDIVFRSGNKGLYWYENQGDGSLNYSYESIGEIKDGEGIAITDINNDSKPDFLNAYDNEDGTSIMLYENQGSGAFEAHTISSTNKSVGQLHHIDINGDGLLDVVASSGKGSKLSWYEASNEPPLSVPVFHKRDLSSSFLVTPNYVITSHNKPSHLLILDITGKKLLDKEIITKEKFYFEKGRLYLIKVGNKLKKVIFK